MKPAPRAAALAPFGLRPHGGWLDAVADDLAIAPDLADVLRHLLSARSRNPAGWPEAQRSLEYAAEYEAFTDVIIPDEPPPPPEIGTDAFHAILINAGPVQGWLDEIPALADHLGRDRVTTAVGRWLHAVPRTKVGLLHRPGSARDALWALIWSTVPLESDLLVERLRQLASWAVHNRAQPASTAGAALAAAQTEPAAAALRLVEQEARRPSPTRRFARLAEHVERRLNLSPDQTAERFVPTCGFAPGGVRRASFGGASAELRVTPDGGVVTSWTNDKGKVVRAAPAAVKRDHSQAVKDLAAAAKDAQKTLAAHRDRLDRLMALPRTWALADWRPCYLDHPLIGLLTRRLIWTLDGAPVTFDAAGHPLSISGKSIKTVDRSHVALWHPINHPADAVLAWRRRLASLEIVQPFKQAHREVYLLTDAERRTNTYSNRFAAHVIRQHPFKAIALSRGWEVQLRLVHDSSDPPPASRRLPAFKLRAEFWTSGIGAGSAADITHAGTLLYLATDQVRFHALDAPEGAAPLPLARVPPLAFSEVMRDVDLFVGVCSVGNDPTWQDGGPAGRFRDYWRAFSFGDLSATAATRRAVLADLLPRLKIRDRATLADRFLVVRGRLRTYKIHLGSGNILMSPNDQYLCIVPDRSDRTPDAFLPFEGDHTLALILSKAFLLAEDDKIADPTITRQIAAG